MDWTVDEHTAKELLMQYSEWLDGEELMAGPSITNWDTHEQLVRKFISVRNPAARPRVWWFPNDCTCGPGDGCTECPTNSERERLPQSEWEYFKHLNEYQQEKNQ
jgi:hypothetical protein